MKENKGSRKFLIFLTSTFPYGNGETFIENEIPFLASSFEKVFILVPAEVVNQEKRPVSENVIILPVKKNFGFTRRFIALLCHSFWQGFLLDLQRKNRGAGFFRVFQNCWHYYTQALQVKRAIQETILHNEIKAKNTILYSYWLDDKALGAALFKRYNPGIKAVSRAHRWDVYEEMHPIPFLPFRPLLGKYLDRLVFISKQGRNYSENQYPEIPPYKLALSYLGTFLLEKNKIQKSQEEFTIVSCSSLITRKRVDLIAQALIECNRTINWTHIGDGPEMEKIEKIATEIENKGGKVTMMGNISNQAVRKFYENKQVDLFISVSESEGLPVSMMEAQSAGIPILATNVGGVNEIVLDGLTGWLLPPNPDPTLIAEKIKYFYELKETAKQKIRENGLTHWQNNFNAGTNYSAFVNILQKL